MSKKADMFIIDDIVPEGGVEWEKVIDPEFGEVNVLNHEHGMIATNGQVGGWVKAGKNSYVSLEYAQSLNRAQRRKEKIQL